MSWDAVTNQLPRCKVKAELRRLFQELGVPEYWIVDADARVIERWRPSDERPEICATSIAWRPSGTDAPIVVDLPALFTAALGE